MPRKPTDIELANPVVAVVPSGRARAALAKRLASVTAQLTTSVVAEVERRHAWFSALDAEHRSWITLVARAGIDHFVEWFRSEEPQPATSVFDAAPRAIMREVSLGQTVELVRTTLDVAETELQHLLPRGDRATVSTALLLYGREIAFAAAAVYAQAAESRGAWDARLEALVVDAVVRGETDETVLSRASTLGWRSTAAVCVVMGTAAEASQRSLQKARQKASHCDLDVLAAIQGERLVCILGGERLTSTDAALKIVAEFDEYFGPGPVVVGPVVDHLADASVSARTAAAGLRAATAWANAPRPVAADDLLPERALAGDGHARRQLAEDVYGTLASAGGDLLETTVTFLDNYGSVEGTARQLYVHANTVRYRLKRIQDVTGYWPTDARDAYVLRLAITLGRLQRETRPRS